MTVVIGSFWGMFHPSCGDVRAFSQIVLNLSDAANLGHAGADDRRSLIPCIHRGRAKTPTMICHHHHGLGVPKIFLHAHTQILEGAHQIMLKKHRENQDADQVRNQNLTSNVREYLV